MKQILFTVPLLFLLGFASINTTSVEPEQIDRTRLWGFYTAEKYGALNEELDGALTLVSDAFGDIGELQQYYDKDRYPKKYEAYQRFLIQVLYDALHGDVGEAMYADFVLDQTPSYIILPMVAHEIGTEGKLEGFFNPKGRSISRYIQRQQHEGSYSSPNFRAYVNYLLRVGKREFATQPNSGLIIEHMFRLDPQEAFVSLLWADYGLNPYSPNYLRLKDKSKEVRKLQQMLADKRLSLPRPPLFASKRWTKRTCCGASHRTQPA